MAERRPLVVPVIVALVMSLPIAALAKTVIEWSSSEPLTGTVEDGELFVEVEGPGVYPLIVVEDPDVQPPVFTVSGTVRHEDVAGTAYFEMWTVLPDQSRYFTRTLAGDGPMGIMAGDSESRPVLLPFDLGEGGLVPTRLEINLVTEGAGRFWVGPMTIISAVEGVEDTTTPTTEATTTSATQAPTTTAEPVATTIPAGEEETGGTGVWWGIAALAALAIAGFGWLRSSRKKRAEEQRRMNAIDSLRS